MQSVLLQHRKAFTALAAIRMSTAALALPATHGVKLKVNASESGKKTAPKHAQRKQNYALTALQSAEQGRTVSSRLAPEYWILDTEPQDL